MRKRFLTATIFFAALGLFFAILPAIGTAQEAKWYRGSTHLHSFWSDGDQLPELVDLWYKSNGYDFLIPTDHNTIDAGEKWVTTGRQGRVPDELVEEAKKQFGPEWVETKISPEGTPMIRLKTFEEISEKLSEPGKFLMIRGEEITGKWENHQVHVNGLNLGEVIQPQQGTDVSDTIRRDIVEVIEQGKRLGLKTAAHVNHPGWPHYDITADQLAAVDEATHFEIDNANSGSNYYGNDKHPGMEKLWDIVTTLRLERGLGPMYGVATDDTHNYHTIGPTKANPGRGWIMVRASELSTDAIIDAFNRGDYYSSTGVTLKDLSFDPQAKTLHVRVEPVEGETYKIVFIGTPKNYDKTVVEVDDPAEGNRTARPDKKYSDDIGKTFATVEGTEATYTCTGEELYVRTIVYSSADMPNPPEGQAQKKMAWIQPVCLPKP